MLWRVGITYVVLWCLSALTAAAGSPGVWLDVPFVKQEKQGCGAASIAMVMQYWQRQQGRPVDATADAGHIQRILYSKKGRGIYASDLERYLNQSGFRTFVLRGNWRELEEHLQKGRPLIVALKPGPGETPLHYLVVAGLDAERDVVFVNDPAQRKLLQQDQASFEREWSAAGRWTLLALPPPEAH
ncbi:MAG TPA: C39 family peptidase [Terriglobales bacterium]|jgi:ABC-type bacteriocin/lantibiotic exporter with double-glycine peptidase domain